MLILKFKDTLIFTNTINNFCSFQFWTICWFIIYIISVLILYVYVIVNYWHLQRNKHQICFEVHRAMFAVNSVEEINFTNKHADKEFRQGWHKRRGQPNKPTFNKKCDLSTPRRSFVISRYLSNLKCQIRFFFVKNM